MHHRNILLSISLLLALFLLFPSPGAHAQTTAKTDFDLVLASASSLGADASLIGLVGTDISPSDGTASSWFYLMQSLEQESLFGIVRTDEEITSPLELSEFPTEVTDMFTPGAFPDTWLDSDRIVAIAEENGGTDFRAAYPDAIISAALIGVPSTDLIDLEIPPLPSLWVVAYSSATESSIVSSIRVIDATLGLYIELEPTTARENLDAADAAASEFANDAELVSVSTLLPDFDGEGRASIWQYTYYSPSLDEGQVVYTAAGAILATSPVITELVSTEPLPSTWLDSPLPGERIDEVELSDSFIQSPSLIQARLSNGLSEEEPGTSFWQLNYVIVEEDILETLVEDEELDGVSITSILVDAGEGDPTEGGETDELSAFILYDADTDQPVPGFSPIPQNAVLDLSALPPSLNIAVEFDILVDQVTFTLNDNLINTERVEPYALFGDVNGDFRSGRIPPAPQYILTATPTVNGIQEESEIVIFEVINTQLPTVMNLMLVDADSDTELFELTNNATLDGNELPANINIVAKTNDFVKSVLFDINQGFFRRLESAAPYAFYGDTNGNYLSGPMPVGDQTLVATPYSEPRAGGVPGTPLTIQFSISASTSSTQSLRASYQEEALTLSIESETPEAYLLGENYPNPFNPETTISFALPEMAQVQLLVYDVLGRHVATVTEATFEAGQHEVRFNSGDLTSGTYFYSLITPNGVFTKKMMLLK